MLSEDLKKVQVEYYQEQLKTLKEKIGFGPSFDEFTEICLANDEDYESKKNQVLF